MRNPKLLNHETKKRPSLSLREINPVRETSSGVVVRVGCDVDMWTRVNGIHVSTIASLTTILKRAHECEIEIHPELTPIKHCWLLRCCARDRNC